MDRCKDSCSQSDKDKCDSLSYSSCESSCVSNSSSSNSCCYTSDNSSCVNSDLCPRKSDKDKCNSLSYCDSSCVTNSSNNTRCYTSNNSSCVNSDSCKSKNSDSCSCVNSDSMNSDSCSCKSKNSDSCSCKSKNSDSSCVNSDSCSCKSKSSLCESDSSCVKNSDCDDSSINCYNPDVLVDCAEDCPLLKCKDINIYWFGSDFSDGGNGRLNLGLIPYTVTETNINPCGVLTQGIGPCGRSSNGKVFSEYVACDFGMKVNMEYDLKALPKKKNQVVIFSITNATQNDNITPLTPPNTFGYKYQVARYVTLYNKSKCYAVPENDLFMYTDVGINTLFKLWSIVLEDPGFDINLYFQNYMSQVIANITKLYSLGKARRMIVQLIDRYTIEQMPIYEKFACLLGSEINIIMEQYEMIQNAVQMELENFSHAQPHFDLTVLQSGDIFEELIENSDAYGIVNNGYTMIDLGWPDKNFENQFWFDDSNPTSHTHRIIANYVKTWFQQKICFD